MPPLVTLRTWQPEDADTIEALLGDERVQRGLAAPPAPIGADKLARLVGYLCTAELGDYPTEYAILHRGNVVGGIGLSPDRYPTRAHSAEVGYYLSPDHWGKGYASQALSLLLDDVFDHTELTRLTAKCFTWNVASLRVLQKNGFGVEGILQNSSLDRRGFQSEVILSRLKAQPAQQLWAPEEALRIVR